MAGRTNRQASAGLTGAASQACLKLKALFGLPRRQATWMVASLLDIVRKDWPVPNFSTVRRRQKALTDHIPYCPRSGALHLLIDCTAVKAEGDGEWLTKKHRPSKPRDWRQHRRGNVGKSGHRDHRQLDRRRAHTARPAEPDRRRPARRHGPADGAYDTPVCHTAITARGATAVIPPRNNGKPWKKHTAGAATRNDALRSYHRLGRAFWKRWRGNLLRNQVEAEIRCFKLLGERVMYRDFDRQVAELQITAAILKRFTALGAPLTQRAAQVLPRERKLHLYWIYSTMPSVQLIATHNHT